MMNMTVNTGSGNHKKWHVELHHFCVYLTLTTVAIGQPILQMYSSNLAVFTTAGLEGIGVLGFMLLVLFVPAIVLYGIEVLVGLCVPRARQLVNQAFIFLCLVLVFLLLTRSITGISWLIHIGLVMCLAAGAFWVFHKVHLLKIWTRWMSSLALIVALSFVLAVKDIVWIPEVGAVNLIGNQNGGGSSLQSDAKDVSVVWIVLDEAPLFPLLNTSGEINRERFAGFAKLADSSTWYRNTLSPSQRTTDAVPSMLTGLNPKVGSNPIYAVYEKNIFTLMNTHVGFDVREFTTSLCPDSICGKIFSSASGNETPDSSEQVGGSRTFEFRQFMKDAVIVLGHKLLPQGLREDLPAIDQAWGGFGGGDVNAGQGDSNDVDQVLESNIDAETQSEKKSTYRESGPASLIPPFEEMVERAKNSVKPVLHFQHVMIPHRPWMLTPDQRMYPETPNPGFVKDKTLPDNDTDLGVLSHQYQALLMQYAAVDQMIGHLVDELKASNNWDRTMIVVTADHGISMESGTFRRRDVKPDQPGTLEDLYRVPLFIKYPSHTEASTNDCDVMHQDIVPTIAAVKQLDAGWRYDGVDLQEQCPDRPIREVNWDKGKTTMSSHWTSLLERVALYDSYVSISGGVDGIFGFGPYTSLMGKQISSASVKGESSIVSWTIDQLNDFANIRSERFANIPAEITGTIQLSRPIPKGSVGVITVNGVIAGFIDEISGASADAAVPYRAMLANSQLKQGPHSVSLSVVSGGAVAVFEPSQLAR